MYLMVAAALALVFPGPGVFAKDYVLVPLAVSVFFSLLGSKQRFRLSFEGMKTGLVYNYLVLSVVLIVFAYFMPPGIREGIMMYALFPPAVGTVALTVQWGGKVEDVFLFQLASYALSVVLIPVAALALIGAGVNAALLVSYVIFAFIIPAALSFAFNPKDKKLMAEISLLFLALVYYIVIAKSASWLTNNWQSMLVYSIPLAAVCLLLGYAVYVFTRDPDSVLYSFLKNGGAAAAASLAILPEAGSAIIAVKTFIDVLLIVVFGMLWKKK